MVSLRKYEGKQLVSYLRNADYAHAGEEDAIELVMDKFIKSPTQDILDVGCGLGGTAEYIQKNGWGKVTGIDVELNSINYATNTYPQLTFIHSDVNHITQVLPAKIFDIFCLFNTYYAFHDQVGALKNLNQLAKQQSTIAFFDYAVDSIESGVEYRRDGNQSQTPFKPIVLNQFEALLAEANWQQTETIDISELYKTWYESLLNKLIQKKHDVINHFGENAYDKAFAIYSHILRGLSNEQLRGVIVYANKR